MKYFSTRGGDERLSFEEVRPPIPLIADGTRSQSDPGDDGAQEVGRKRGRAPTGSGMSPVVKRWLQSDGERRR